MRNLSWILGLCVTICGPSLAQKSESLADFESSLNAEVSLHRATGMPSFIRFRSPFAASLTKGTASNASKAFIRQYAGIFGGLQEGINLKLEQTTVDPQGFRHLTLQQYFHGIPIFDGQLKFHYDAQNQLRTINGNFLPFIKIDHRPAINLKESAELALAHVQNQVAKSIDLHVENNALSVFRKGLAQGISGDYYLCYYMEVTDGSNVREFIFVDAQTGQIIEQFTGTRDVLFRKLYEVNTGNEIWTEGDTFPGTLDQWQQNELEAAAHTYYFFFHALGIDSYDGAGAEMKTVNNDPDVDCPNAQWSGGFARYCTGTASDDVVAHEWGHAYTDFSSNLIYQWQAGAINESLSDIWGETIDLINDYEDDGEDLSIRSGCGSSLRWMLGEDASAFGGAIRDMWDPTCKNDPGKVSDPQYVCSSIDQGGVHSNSGVPNHAYALLVDGGTYNGQTISGLGITKAAHIFARANFYYLTETSDFSVLADALETAANDLVGIDLEGFSTTPTAVGPSGEIISIADISELQKVLLAVEMRMAPNCNFDPLLTEDTILCVMAVPDSAIYYEDFEAGFGDWTFESIPSNPGTWNPRDWEIVANLPGGRIGSAVFGVDPVIGDCDTDLENGLLRLESPTISIPAGVSGEIEMAFDHYVAMENLWDGGNIKYRLNGGIWKILPGGAFTVNPYNRVLNGGGNDNPLAGEEAFSGTDEGSVSGSWAMSVINLSNLGVVPESDLQFRFEVGTDGCNGRVGWYIDNLRIFTCAACAEMQALAAERSMQEILFEAGTTIVSADTISNLSHIIYSAGDEVQFDAGFVVMAGSVLETRMDGCTVPSSPPTRRKSEEKIPMGILPNTHQEYSRYKSNSFK